jgi:hypothetical protein
MLKKKQKMYSYKNSKYVRYLDKGKSKPWLIKLTMKPANKLLDVNFLFNV